MSRRKFLIRLQSGSSKRTIHEIYIASILIIIIVFLCTYNFGDNQRLTEYVSFALTISSILLALVAIGMTIIGNTNLERNFANLAKANFEINKNSKNIALVSDQLAGQIANLSVYVQEIRQNVSVTSDKVAELHRNQSTYSANEMVASGEINQSSAYDFEKFWQITSWSGRIFLYIVSRYAETQKSIKIDEIAENVYNDGFNNNFDYIHGFWVACISSGFIVVRRAPDGGECVASAFSWDNGKIRNEITKVLNSSNSEQENPPMQKDLVDYNRDLFRNAESYIAKDLDLIEEN